MIEAIYRITWLKHLVRHRSIKLCIKWNIKSITTLRGDLTSDDR